MTFKELRRNCGYRTQGELAKKLDIDISTVSKWELGSSMPTGKRLIALSELLNKSADEILACFR